MIQPLRLPSPGDACQAELLFLEIMALVLPPSPPPRSQPGRDGTAEITKIFEVCFSTGFIPV